MADSSQQPELKLPSSCEVATALGPFQLNDKGGRPVSAGECRRPRLPPHACLKRDEGRTHPPTPPLAVPRQRGRDRRISGRGAEVDVCAREGRAEEGKERGARQRVVSGALQLRQHPPLFTLLGSILKAPPNGGAVQLRGRNCGARRVRFSIPAVAPGPSKNRGGRPFRQSSRAQSLAEASSEP